MRPVVGRMAPTPSGHLHLGNALAFGAAWLQARRAGGRVLLRVEDIDKERSRAEVAQAQREDLRWLGLDWDEETPPQSSRTYDAAGLPTYRCDCPRQKRLSGGCSCRNEDKRSGALRLRGEALPFVDRIWGEQTFPAEDPVLIKADGEPGYPLAVVLDDLRDGVTEVVRGADLLSATPAQIQIWRALGAEPPTWTHTPVLLEPDGRKLAKSRQSSSVRGLRELGFSPAQVWALLLPLLGSPAPTLEDAELRPEKVPRGRIFVHEVDGRPRILVQG